MELTKLGSRSIPSKVLSRDKRRFIETGGGIHKALPMLGSQPFLVVNADIYTDMPVPDMSLGDSCLGHLVMVPTPDNRECGDFNIDAGLVRNDANATCTFSGVAIYRPEFFAGCEAGRFSIAPMLREAADCGQLSGSLYEGLWADAGTPDRLEALKASL